MIGDPNSQDGLEFYTSLVVHLIADFAAIVDSSKISSIARDQKYVRLRSKAEGLGFFTKSLPSLGRALDKALATGLPLQIPSSFKKTGGKPNFLRAFWDLVIDNEGLLNDNAANGPAAANAVRAIRQVCYLFYKLEVPYDESLVRTVLERFVNTDKELPQRDDEIYLDALTDRALRSAAVLIARVLCEWNPHNITPAHGPGATAGGEKPWQKKFFSRYIPQLDSVYSYTSYFYRNEDVAQRYRKHHLEKLPVDEAVSARIAVVPKDSRGPRIISMEPVERMFIQQGQMRSLVDTIESHSLTGGFVNFRCQEINRELARAASLPNADFVTLDMKDASDRVSSWLVKTLLPYHAYRALEATRSSSTMLPDGTQVILRKFAPMGSAVCFPVEALIFWALCVGATTHILRPADLKNLPAVYVYGDDIILHKESYHAVKHVLEGVHLRLNEDKCCLARLFRESCGYDAFNGLNVSPLRIKHVWTDTPSPQARLAYISYVNELGERGYLQAQEFLANECIQAFGPIPYANRSGNPYSFVCEELSDGEVNQLNSLSFRSRYDKMLQKRVWRFPAVEPIHIKYGRPDEWELNRVLSVGSSYDQWGILDTKPTPCDYALPGVLQIRYKWLTNH